MAHAREAARSYDKSDFIDALAVARAALHHQDLPVAELDGPAWELRLLLDHREDLLAERTCSINRLCWQLLELGPTWDPLTRSLTAMKNLDVIIERLAVLQGRVARIADEIVTRIRELTVHEGVVEHEITALLADLAPILLRLVGAGALTTAKIVTETADVRCFFQSKDGQDQAVVATSWS